MALVNEILISITNLCVPNNGYVEINGMDLKKIL